MSLTVCTWLYGAKWGEHYVEKLFAGLRRNIKQPFRCALISDRPVDARIPIDIRVQFDADADANLVNRLGCLVRMRMFDRNMQKLLGTEPGDRIVNIDVDAVITGNLDPLFDRDDEFTILQNINSTNPNPFNGSVWQFRAGERHDVWEDFSWEAVCKVKYHAIPDDQAWLWSRFPNAAAWGPDTGVYGFKKRGWTTGRVLPDNARIVAFPGRDPAKYAELYWVKEHWHCSTS